MMEFINGKDDNPYMIWEKKCLKPPTSDVSDLLINEAGFDPVISEN
jgi:hypothetical protein